MSILVCDNISKINKRKNSVRNFNFNFLEKKIYAIVGKSDSGKELLLDLMNARIPSETGCVYLDGEPLYNNTKMKDRICYIDKSTVFAKNITVKGVLKHMKRKYPKWDNKYAYDLLEYFNIKPSTLYIALQKNQKSLLLGICSIASRCNITVYNDPVSEVDVKDRYDFYNFLYNHHIRYPRTIIIATDFVDEIDYMFDKVLFVEKGKLIEFFTRDEIKNNFRYLTGKTEVLKSLLSGIKVVGVEERGGTLTVCIRKKLNKDEIRKFQKYLIKISEVPIQKIFIYLINLRGIKERKNMVI